MQTISFDSTHESALRVMREEVEPNSNADAQKQHRRAVAIVDGLVSVAQQAWTTGLTRLSHNKPATLH
jgi:hypothetical protein